MKAIFKFPVNFFEEWKELSFKEQISSGVGMLVFLILLKSSSQFIGFMNTVARFYQKSTTSTSNFFSSVIDTSIIFVLVLLGYAILRMIVYCLDMLSKIKVAEGLDKANNYAFWFFFLLIVVSPFLQRIGLTNVIVTYVIFFVCIVLITFATSFYILSLCNLILSFYDWITARDVRKSKKDEEARQRGTITLTFLGVLISVIALFK